MHELLFISDTYYINIYYSNSITFQYVLDIYIIQDLHNFVWSFNLIIEAERFDDIAVHITFKSHDIYSTISRWISFALTQKENGLHIDDYSSG